MSAKYDWPISVTGDDLTPAIAIVGAITGIIGACLGVFNFLLSWRRERVRLNVKPTFLFHYPSTGGSPNPSSYYTTPRGEKIPRIWGVEVTNKGTTVKLKEVGFLIRGTSDRAVISDQYPRLHVNLPHSLERHDSVTIFGAAPSDDTNFEEFAKFKCAFARTTAGKSFTGNSKGFRAVLRQLK